MIKLTEIQEVLAIHFRNDYHLVHFP